MNVQAPLSTDRPALLAALAARREVDVAVIGGGATGLGIALDAVLRGFSVVLLEAHDFAKGTSSRATKLVHGGVRYLAQGRLSLVREALRERATLLRNAPHVVHPLPFLIPAYRCWELPFYGMGLKAYDALAAGSSLGRSTWLSAGETRACVPGVRSAHLRGGIRYWDAQFDDARLAIVLARTAAAQGALLLNYCAVTDLLKQGARISGLVWEDAESGLKGSLHARCVINATGVWADQWRARDADGDGTTPLPTLLPSQGAHLVVDADFLSSDHAVLVPRTSDGRVLFAVPWLGKVLLGTTDTPQSRTMLEPRPLAAEVAFILAQAAGVLERPPQHADIRSAWAGLRPLFRLGGSGTGAGKTSGISREHAVLISRSGLVTVIGGKWTTYRSMAEDTLNQCVEQGLLPRLAASRTAQFPLLGAERAGGSGAGADPASVDEGLVRFAVRHEYARCVEDVLARRSRLLFLDARAAQACAPEVARVLREETGADPGLEAFLELARAYVSVPD